MLTVGSLFAGIGGFDLGLERAGMRVTWQSEIDEFCRAVLARHWPEVPRFGDVRGLTSSSLPPVDVLCGGFPCQDLSSAGNAAGLVGERSGLWVEFVRLASELRPGYIIVENVSALLVRGLGRILGDLAEIGYDAEWDCIPASALGAPHPRDRVWVVAYPSSPGLQGHRPGADGSASAPRTGAPARGGRPGDARLTLGRTWRIEPDVGRMADGVPARVDRLRALGNALVPQIAQWIGGRIVSWELFK